MSNPIVAVSSAAAPPTLLGQAPARIPTGGKIRAGIKVLTKAAAENPQALAIYERGVADGQSFEQIEEALTAALPHLKTPLVPKNVAWFTVRGEDFPNPEIARQILDAYGEDRGDGVVRLYRFPVVFPAPQWQAVMPHELVAWGANERRFWSEYGPDGRVRYCKTYAPVPLNDTGKRVIRLFGGRKSVSRAENGGLCDPERCEDYQQRRCNLSGRFIFFIPGIRSISAFELHTNSFYAMNAAIQKFETIAFLRGGRISGFLDARNTPFYLTKRLMEVPLIDQTGRAVRVKQWIIELEAPIDVTALLRSHEDEETVIVQAQLASQILEGSGGMVDIPVDGVQAPSWSEGEDSGDPAPTWQNTAHDKPAAPNEPKTIARPPTIGTPAGPSLEQVIDAACAYGIDAARYEAYADRRWGSGWKRNAAGRRGALEELARYAADPEGYRDKIECELRRVPPQAPKEQSGGRP